MKLEFQQQPVGTIKLFAQKQDDNTISATVDLTENGNAVNIKGNYFLNNDQKQFRAGLNINRLSMATLQTFSKGNLTRSSGNINGNISLQGKFSDPRWNGALNFDTTQFTIAKLGTTYTLDKQKINLTYPEISFNNFTIKDSTNNSLKVDGRITSKTIADYDLDLKINADNFTLVNAPKAVANQVYGFAAIDADIAISGTSASPDIQGNLSLNDKTDVTLVLPEKI
ncbi:MAG: translocation/assembly module TamB domain-containing protein [Chitinophagaceae bacterium]|nr:translocation/assembly module TamB domain-containing protein [Chitinophagaceae bacterium]